MLRTLACVLGLLMCTELNAAAWTLEEGHGQIIHNITLYQSDRYVDAEGSSSSQDTYTKFENNPYVEYGITDVLTVGFSPSIQWVSQKIAGAQESNFNLADTELFLRQRLYKDDANVIAIQPLVKLPGFYDKADRPGLGQGQADYELRLLYGHNFGTNGRHYLNTEAAYRIRSEEPGDEVRLAGTVGYRVNERWQALLEAQGTFAVDGAGGAASGAQLSNTFDYDLVKLQLSGLYWLTPEWALQLGGFRSIYSRNTGEGGGALFSIWYRF